jgi:hypothetical protein
MTKTCPSHIPARTGSGRSSLEGNFGGNRRSIIILGLEIELADEVIILEKKEIIGVSLEIEPTDVLVV